MSSLRKCSEDLVQLPQKLRDMYDVVLGDELENHF